MEQNPNNILQNPGTNPYYKDFIPQIWSKAILDAWQRQTIMAELSNRSYEGEVKFGNSVKITSLITPGVQDYRAQNRQTYASEVNDIAQLLLIDQEKTIDFYVSDIDEVQRVAPLMSNYVDKAGAELAKDTDEHLIQVVADGSQAADNNSKIEDSPSALDSLYELNYELDIQDAPINDRVALVSPRFYKTLMTPKGNQPQVTLSDAGFSGDSANPVLRKAVAGGIAGFEVIPTNLIKSNTAIGLNKETLAYANQIDKMESMRMEHTFGDRVRMLHVYGAKLLERPDADKTVVHVGEDPTTRKDTKREVGVAPWDKGKKSEPAKKEESSDKK